MLLILVKIFYYNRDCEEIRKFGETMCGAFKELSESADGKIRSMTAACYVKEACIAGLNYFNAAFLFVAISVQPLFTSAELPFRAKFAFDTGSGSGFALMYGLQVLATFLLLQHILAMDGVGLNALCELWLHLSVLDLRLKRTTASGKSEAMARLLSFIQGHQQAIA